MKTKESINLNENKIGAKENKLLQEEFMKGKKQIDEDHLYEKIDSKEITNNTGTKKASVLPKISEKHCTNGSKTNGFKYRRRNSQ